MSNAMSNFLPISLGFLIRVLSGAALMATLTGCTELTQFITKFNGKPKEPVIAEQPPAPTSSVTESSSDTKDLEKPKPSKLYQWNGDGRKVTRIVINTNEQKAHFYADDEEVGWSTVATGVSKYPTPVGQFAVIEKVENKRSNLYGKIYGKGGQVIRSNVKVGRDPIPAGARFEGSHMPYYMRLTHDGIGLHAGPIPRPGQPASHGCIRMPKQLAPVLFQHVAHGTAVSIVGSGPNYGNYIEKQRAIAAAAARAAEQRRLAAQKAAETANDSTVTAMAGKAPVTPVASTTEAVTQPAIGVTVQASSAQPGAVQTLQVEPAQASSETTTQPEISAVAQSNPNSVNPAAGDTATESSAVVSAAPATQVADGANQSSQVPLQPTMIPASATMPTPTQPAAPPPAATIQVAVPSPSPASSEIKEAPPAPPPSIPVPAAAASTAPPAAAPTATVQTEPQPTTAPTPEKTGG